MGEDNYDDEVSSGSYSVFISIDFQAAAHLTTTSTPTHKKSSKGESSTLPQLSSW